MAPLIQPSARAPGGLRARGALLAHTRCARPDISAACGSTRAVPVWSRRVMGAPETRRAVCGLGGANQRVVARDSLADGTKTRGGDCEVRAVKAEGEPARDDSAGQEHRASAVAPRIPAQIMAYAKPCRPNPFAFAALPCCCSACSSRAVC